MPTARSRLPIVAADITINGVALTTAKIFGSGSVTVTKNIARNITEGGITRAVIGMSAEGSVQMGGDLQSTLETDDANPGATVGDQDHIQIFGASGIDVFGTVTCQYNQAQNQTSVTFSGSVQADGFLGDMGVVDGTSAGNSYESS